MEFMEVKDNKVNLRVFEQSLKFILHERTKLKISRLLAQYQLSQRKLKKIGLNANNSPSAYQSITFTISGKLDRRVALKVQKTLMYALSCYSAVEFNLSQLLLIDTSGLAILINVFRKAKVLKKSFKLTGVNANINKVFVVNKLDRIFH